MATQRLSSYPSRMSSHRVSPHGLQGILKGLCTRADAVGKYGALAVQPEPTLASNRRRRGSLGRGRRRLLRLCRGLRRRRRGASWPSAAARVAAAAPLEEPWPSLPAAPQACGLAGLQMLAAQILQGKARLVKIASANRSIRCATFVA